MLQSKTRVAVATSSYYEWNVYHCYVPLLVNWNGQELIKLCDQVYNSFQLSFRIFPPEALQSHLYKMAFHVEKAKCLLCFHKTRSAVTA
jgi:hypothetical protein